MLRRFKFTWSVLLLLSSGGWSPSEDTLSAGTAEACIGYSIIEFGKAVDCRGDTIRLTRRNGLQVFMAEAEKK